MSRKYFQPEPKGLLRIPKKKKTAAEIGKEMAKSNKIRINKIFQEMWKEKLNKSISQITS